MSERRKSKRYRPNQQLVARVRTTVPAQIIDLSETGAKIEIDSSCGPSAILRPGTVCDLWLPRSGADPLRIPAEVRYCRAVGVGKTPDGDPTMLYRSGLEFRFDDESSREALRSHIAGHLPPRLRPDHGEGRSDDEGGSGDESEGEAKRERVRVRVNVENVRRRVKERDQS